MQLGVDMNSPLGVDGHVVTHNEEVQRIHDNMDVSTSSA